MASQYFIRRGRKVIGPVSLAKVKQSIANGKVLAEDQISKLRDGPWQAIGEVPQLSSLLTMAPPPLLGTPKSQKEVISDFGAGPEVDQLKASSLPPGVGGALPPPLSPQVPDAGNEQGVKVTESNTALTIPVVKKWKVKRGLRGKYTIAHECPKCATDLNSDESDIQQRNNCPRC